MRFTALLILIFLGWFTGTALAGEAIASGDTSTLIQNIFDAVVHGQWWAAAAVGVVLACTIARKYMPHTWTEGVAGDLVGTATAFVMAFAGAIGTWALAPGAVMPTGVALTALKIGTAAIGGYTVIHKLATYLAAWDKLPAWAAPLVKLAAALIGSDAIAKADAAGAAALAADPPKGLAGDTAITEVK